MAVKVAGEKYESITGQLFEIGRQLRQPNGYPFDPEELQRHLQLAVEGKFQLRSPTCFPIWKTLKRPANASAAYYRESFKKKGISIGTYADQILDKMDFAEGSDEVDIARVYVRDLGFKTNTRRDAIYKKALTSGLAKLPAWVAVELRDRYDGQPNGEWLIAGMEPTFDRDDSPVLFLVGRHADGERWLNSSWGYADYGWNLGCEFLFAVPRK